MDQSSHFPMRISPAVNKGLSSVDNVQETRITRIWDDIIELFVYLVMEYFSLYPFPKENQQRGM